VKIWTEVKCHVFYGPQCICCLCLCCHVHNTVSCWLLRFNRCRLKEPKRGWARLLSQIFEKRNLAEQKIRLIFGLAGLCRRPKFAAKLQLMLKFSAEMQLQQLHNKTPFCFIVVKNLLFYYFVCMCIAWKGHPWNDLYCFGWDIKPYSLAQLINHVAVPSSMTLLIMRCQSSRFSEACDELCCAYFVFPLFAWAVQILQSLTPLCFPSIYSSHYHQSL